MHTHTLKGVTDGKIFTQPLLTLNIEYTFQKGKASVQKNRSISWYLSQHSISIPADEVPSVLFPCHMHTLN